MNTGRELAVSSNAANIPVVYAVLPDVYAQPGLSPSQAWAIVWAYRKLSISIALVIMSITVAVIALLPRSYQATATLMVNYEVNDPLNGKEFPIGLLSSYMATQTELMRNPAVLLTVVDRLNLTANEDYTDGYRGDGSTLREYAQRQLSEDLTIYQGQFGSELLYVTDSASDPAEAALIANTVVDVFKEENFARAAVPTTERAERYAEQLEQLRVKVVQAQEQYTAFHQRNALIDTGDNRSEVEIGLLTDLQQELSGAQQARRTAQVLSAGNQAVGDSVMGSPLIQALKSQLATQELRLAELQTTLGPRHPQMIELRSQIATSRRMLDSEVGSYALNSATGVSASQALEGNLQVAVDAQREKVLSASALRDQAAKYRLELESAQSVYKRALDGYDQIMFASLGNYTNVSVVSRATPPVKPSKPRVMVYLLLGVMAGGFFGLFGPLVYELANRRVRCRDDLERDNGVPVLAEFESLAMARRVA